MNVVQIALGAVIGSVLGSGYCEAAGTCLLTSKPWIGTISGGRCAGRPDRRRVARNNIKGVIA